jgi:hypothetical protein
MCNGSVKLYGTGQILSNLATRLWYPRILAVTVLPMLLLAPLISQPHRNGASDPLQHTGHPVMARGSIPVVMTLNTGLQSVSLANWV